MACPGRKIGRRRSTVKRAPHDDRIGRRPARPGIVAGAAADRLEPAPGRRARRRPGLSAATSRNIGVAVWDARAASGGLHAARGRCRAGAAAGRTASVRTSASPAITRQRMKPASVILRPSRRARNRRGSSAKRRMSAADQGASKAGACDLGQRRGVGAGRGPQRSRRHRLGVRRPQVERRDIGGGGRARRRGCPARPGRRRGDLDGLSVVGARQQMRAGADDPPRTGAALASQHAASTAATTSGAAERTSAVERLQVDQATPGIDHAGRSVRAFQRSPPAPPACRSRPAARRSRDADPWRRQVRPAGR